MTRPCRLAVVEDDVDLLEELIELLEIHGFEVRGATDLAGGYALCRDWKPDWILADVDLSGDSGLDFVEFLAAYADGDLRPRLLFLTGAPLTHEQHGAEEESRFQILVKPLNVSTLLEILRR